MNYKQFLIKSACNSVLVKLSAREGPIVVAGGKANKVIGSGHQSPAKAIAALLEQHPGIQSLGGVKELIYPYEEERKLEHGKRPIYEETRKYPMMISTGYSPGEIQETYVPTKGWGAEPPTHTMNYLLDLPASPHNVMTNYSMNPIQHAYALRPEIGYGSPDVMPNLHKLRVERFKSGVESFKDMFSHDPISATILLGKSTPKSIKELMTKRRSFPFYRTGTLPPAVHPEIMKMLEQVPETRENWENLLYNNPDVKIQRGVLKGKPVVAISGSGRGDFVASRAFDLAAHLKTIGDKDTQIVAMTGGDPERAADIRKILSNVPEDMKSRLHIVDRLPQQKFVQFLRGPGNDPNYVHWGSSGASSAMESLLGGGKTVLPEHIWNMQDRSNELAGKYGTVGEDIAYWMHPVHKGILKEWKRRGLAESNTPEAVMELLKNPKAVELYRQAAATAKKEVLGSQENLKNLIYNQLKSIKEHGRFMHSTGAFEPGTHPHIFSMDPKQIELGRMREIRSLLSKMR